MDTIQLARDVPLQRTIQHSHSFFFTQQNVSEATPPLLMTYFEWLRIIDTRFKKRDLIHKKNNKKDNEFKFPYKYDLLFFLTVTKQFNVIEQLFKTSSLANLSHSRVIDKTIPCKAKPKKRKRLSLLFPLKLKNYSLVKKKNDTRDLSDVSQQNIVHQLSPELKRKKIKTPEEESEKLMLEYYEDELCLEKPQISSAGVTNNNLTFFTNCTKHSINLKNRPFMAQRLTFFSSSPQYKNRKTKQFVPSFSLSEQKKERNMRL
ncbi:hypothetical protein OQJ19_10870 [Fluoribacter gormanii]|uniref:hypothetical protein n=1 Tax=Fluoribacter gormanii TaxID=464 RepID=UPI002244B482|nr:hypothetical protein [Fluoribacter gormanii]MCW8471150.1 hypothetical protein [Fluoribacter gormanii]